MKQDINEIKNTLSLMKKTISKIARRLALNLDKEMNEILIYDPTNEKKLEKLHEAYIDMCMIQCDLDEEDESLTKYINENSDVEV